MNKPISRETFDIAEIDAALAAEKAERKATTRMRWKLFLFLGLIKVMAGAIIVIPHA
jgi:hypothetical protein